MGEMLSVARVVGLPSISGVARRSRNLEALRGMVEESWGSWGSGEAGGDEVRYMRSILTETGLGQSIDTYVWRYETYAVFSVRSK